MPQICKVMIVEDAGAREPLRQRLLEHYHVEFRSQRVDSEAELRALARDFEPDLVLSTDDLPASPEAEAGLIRLLSRQCPQLLVCEVGDGNAVQWEPRAVVRRALPAAPSVARRDLRPASSFNFAQGLPDFFERSTDAVVIVDAEGWVGFANGTACALLGRYFPEPVGTYLAAGPARGRGEWAEDTPGSNVIKLRVRQPRPVHGLVVFEAATRVATRVHLEDLVRAKTARGRDQDGCLPLVALELGGLQLLSDNYGRSVCDELFSVITSVVQPHYARCGFIASLGNGEHLVVLPNVSEAADAAVAVQGRQSRVQEYAMTDEFELFDEPANDPPLLHEVVRTSPQAPVRAASAAPIHLGDALRRSAISVHYQPQYDMDTGEGCGVEALARWTLSNGETLMPGAFLPIAERTGMIGRLGAAVLDDACAMAKTWRGRDGERLTISVNVSSSQINAEYTRTLAEALKRCGFPARRLELEIDESALIEAGAETLARIREWRGMGVRIAINHLGSNYSSLAYLSHTRVDRLKLDRSVVQRMTENRQIAGFVHAVISLGREFDVDVLAQGVESTEQLEMLREMGCRHVQGFLLARPMPAVQAQLALRRTFGNLPRAAQASSLPAAQAH